MAQVKFARKIIDVFLYGILSSIIVMGISILLEKAFPIKAYDIMTILGLLVVAGAALSNIGGNPMGLGMNNIGQDCADRAAIFNLEATRMEREITNYYSSTANHTKLFFTSSKLHVIMIGVFIIATSIIFSMMV